MSYILVYEVRITSYKSLYPRIRGSHNLFCCAQVVNSNGLHQLLADAIFEIIDRKSVVFPKATSSKADYLDIPPWRRAMIFVFLARFLCNKKGQQRWRAYSLSDYKFNVRCFRRYMEKDADILRFGRQFLRTPPQRQNKKRDRITAATSDSTPDMARLRFAVKDNSSTKEEPVRAAALPAATPSPSTPRTTASTSTAAALPPASPSAAGLFSDDSSSEDDDESYHTDSDNDGKQDV